MDLVQTITENELGFIAGLDYGQDRDRHEAALRLVINQQGGQLKKAQQWFPYEVIELGAHHLQVGHEREFAICTLLVIRSVRSGFDKATDLAEKRAARDDDYRLLPANLRDAIDVEFSDAIRAGPKH
ncbi:MULTISPECIES: hypothetical protein [Dyella]|uniref:Uncharacterized protein n=2 Tax=Dyella TaxID=231454 RepID=A0A4R0YWW1_9GAMM|nr:MULTISPECIES: hypothetical protein [Dyella]TBR40599.1 hypothetical protein EYV96_10720 [Dyella terrae]TCI11819.1 hypothetical protein EZM97_00150 [Dyella soli]